MACIFLWSSAVRVYDSQAYRKIGVTRERISRILELREIGLLLSIQTGFSLHYLGREHSSVVERQTRDRNVPGFIPNRSGRRFLFSQLTFYADFYFRILSTPIIPQWHVKDPGHSTKSADGRLHLNMHAPLTQ